MNKFLIIFLSVSIICIIFACAPAAFAHPDRDTYHEGTVACESVVKGGENTVLEKLDVGKTQYILLNGCSSLNYIIGQLAIYYQAIPVIIEKNQELLRKTFRKYGTGDILSYMGWRGKIKFALYAISPQLFLYVKSCHKKVKKKS